MDEMQADNMYAIVDIQKQIIKNLVIPYRSKDLILIGED